MNKSIHRPAASTRIFDHRTLERDYATLIPAISKGMRVLDVGCGTGAISKGIAERVGGTGHVTGIDNTESFIASGRETYKDVQNLELVCADLFRYQPEQRYDLVVAARVLQWLSNPLDAIKKMMALLKPGGKLSVLDYNHEALEWKPEPPESMVEFYRAFLKWRANAGMNNRIADDLHRYFSDAGLISIVVLPADEVYVKSQPDFLERAGIWCKVAELKQIVDEGFVAEDLRLKAIADYTHWLHNHATTIVMKLKEVRGCAGSA
jgi:ubiquinone/menaquinone biosynthesis C-methylase UbiE